jgi:hypothetical protein
VALGLAHRRVIPLPGQAEAHRVVGGAELHHVDPGHGQDRLEVLDRGLLLDHERDHRVVQRLHERGRADLDHVADVAPHADPVETARVGVPRATARTHACASATVRMSANNSAF